MPAPPSVSQHSIDYECAEYINRLIFTTHELTHRLNPFGLLSAGAASHPKSIGYDLTVPKRCGRGETLAWQKKKKEFMPRK